MKPKILVLVIVFLMILLLVACDPASSEDNEVITSTPEYNYCKVIYSGWEGKIIRCDYNDEICYSAFESDGGASIYCLSK